MLGEVHFSPKLSLGRRRRRAKQDLSRLGVDEEARKRRPWVPQVAWQIPPPPLLIPGSNTEVQSLSNLNDEKSGWSGWATAGIYFIVTKSLYGLHSIKVFAATARNLILVMQRFQNWDQEVHRFIFPSFFFFFCCFFDGQNLSVAKWVQPFHSWGVPLHRYQTKEKMCYCPMMSKGRLMKKHSDETTDIFKLIYVLYDCEVDYASDWKNLRNSAKNPICP